MSNVLFFGDLHAGHKNVAKYRTQFRDEQDHFEAMEIAYHKVVTKRDKCFFMGDAVFSENRLSDLKKWKGEKCLILGNHDTEHLTIKQLAEVFDSIHGLKKYKEFWLSHAPMHPAELRGKVNIHGHVHSSTIYNNISGEGCNYFNTSLENIDYKPISLHQIRVIMDLRIQKRLEDSQNIHHIPDMELLLSK